MNERTEKGEILNSIIYATFQLNGTLIERGNDIANPFGLTSARWQVLSAISLEERPLSVSQIARRMGLTRQSVRRLVGELQKLDMLESSPNLDHKSSLVFSLSELGRESLDKTENTQMKIVNDVSKDLSVEQLNTALEVIAFLKKRIDEADIKPES